MTAVVTGPTPAGGILEGQFPNPDGFSPAGEALITALAGATTGFTHVQVSASSVWDFDHPLGFRPAVSAVDNSGNDIEGDVAATASHVTITFSAAVAGTAYLS